MIKRAKVSKKQGLVEKRKAREWRRKGHETMTERSFSQPETIAPLRRGLIQQVKQGRERTRLTCIYVRTETSVRRGWLWRQSTTMVMKKTVGNNRLFYGFGFNSCTGRFLNARFVDSASLVAAARWKRRLARRIGPGEITVFSSRKGNDQRTSARWKTYSERRNSCEQRRWKVVDNLNRCNFVS